MSTDYRSRNILARGKLAEFQAFCESRGWVNERVKGDYEILRMRHPDWQEPLIVHTRNSMDSVHLTTWGNSADMLRRYMRVRRTQP